MRLSTGIRSASGKLGGAFTMSFSQHKFMGFRCKYEYDAKVVIIASDQQIIVMTYTLEQLGETTFSGRRSKDDYDKQEEEESQLLHVNQ